MYKKKVPISLKDFLDAVIQSIEMLDVKLAERNDIMPMKITKVSANISVNVNVKENPDEPLDYNDIIVDFSGRRKNNTIKLTIKS